MALGSYLLERRSVDNSVQDFCGGTVPWQTWTNANTPFKKTADLSICERTSTTWALAVNLSYVRLNLNTGMQSPQVEWLLTAPPILSLKLLLPLLCACFMKQTQTPQVSLSRLFYSLFLCVVLTSYIVCTPLYIIWDSHLVSTVLRLDLIKKFCPAPQHLHALCMPSVILVE